MALPKSTIPTGTILSGKYEVGRELGRGGMAAVYEASNIDIGKRVAVKLLAGHLARSQTVVERFKREARAVAKIRSPHICDVYDVDRLEDGTPFLVLELLEGESLYDAMVRDRQMSPPLTLSIVLQVCRGLAKAHEVDIVHRDLKPENIFLTVDDDGELLVKILDFGLAKFYDPLDADEGDRHARLTREGAVFGTPAYMSPEQVRGQAAADTRADLWALACITYECFTGTTVWKTEDGVAMTFAQIATSPVPDPRAYRPDLPESFIEWFFRALDRDIARRFQTVQELADGLVAAFDYSAQGGGLDAGLIHRITHEAAAGGDGDIITQRRSGGGRSGGGRSGGGRSGEGRSGEGRSGEGRSGEGRSEEGERKRPSPAPVETPKEAPPQASRRRSASFPTSGGAVALHDDLDLLPAPRGSRNRIVGAVLLALVVVVAVASLASQGDDKPPPEVKQFGTVAARLAKTQPAADSSSGFRFVAGHPWIPRVREAQVLLARGDPDRAIAMLRRVYDESKHGVARNLMEQAQVASVAKSQQARCQVTGYARPRLYDLVSQEQKPVVAGPPVIAFGIGGAVVAWTDAREGQPRVYAVPIDESLRNRSPAVDVTPEGFSVGVPTILPVAQRFLAVYWDFGGSAPGTYLRWLGSGAVIAGAPVLCSQKRPGRYLSHAARTKAGGFVVAWAHQLEADSIDLFLRHFDEAAQPTGEVARLTDFLNRGAQRTSVGHVAVASTGEAAHLAYEVSRGPLQQIRYLRVPLVTKGLSDRTGPPRERVTGTETLLTPATVKARLPSIGCLDEGCFVAWQESTGGGASVAFVDAKSGKTQWHKSFAPRGKHPTIGVAPNGSARLVWYEAGRVTTAALSRSGVGPDSKIGRVVGDQPPASIAPGAQRDEWYIAWLDYESGRLEPYAARTLCQ